MNLVSARIVALVHKILFGRSSVSRKKRNKMAWGDKGEEYRPDKCTHDSDDGCEWCCEKCNKDQHLCPKCGTISNHKEEPCNPCS
jgi:hypothetical protein